MEIIAALWELIKEILVIPKYYSEHEADIATILSILSLISGAVFSKYFIPDRTKIFLALAIAIIMGLIYYFIIDMGKILIWQLIVRCIFSAALTYIIFGSLTGGGQDGENRAE